MNFKRSILFVDDEQNILDGLKRMLRGMKNEWDMHFVNSGREALGLLKGTHVDVIVSDMRMSEMDGAALLQEVSESYPQIVRIVLSGQADKEEIFRSVGPSHQYLSKPCDAEKLKLIIKRAFALRDMLNDPSLKNLVSKIKKLPSQPKLYMDLMKAVKNENISLKYIGQIIQKDMAMTAQILKLVNSSYFGFGKTMTEPAQAVSYLGLDLIKSLVLSIDIFEKAGESDLLSVEMLWQHSWDVATFARDIANHMGASEEVSNESFTAGLLHDCGRIIFATNFPDQYFKYLERLNHDENKNIKELENEIFGATHEAVGAYLLGIWGLPDSIVEAVALHGNPRNTFSDEFTALTALHIADAIDYFNSKHKNPWSISKVDRAYVRELGIEDKIPEFVELHKKLQESLMVEGRNGN